MINAKEVRGQFPYLGGVANIQAGEKRDARIFLDSTASTQIPLPVLETVVNSVFDYANVHRGEYNASQKTTETFERTYNMAANFVNADSWREIILGRSTTEMVNLVARGLASQFRDGDNIVVTRLEHNSNYVPWFALSQDAARTGKKIDVRVVDFDKTSGEVDMNQMAKYVDKKTKLVGCTGASNFLGTKPNLATISGIAHSSEYSQPDGTKGSYFLVDGAQFVPGCPTDVQEIGCDFLAWSFHKMLVPFGVGGLYGKQKILEQMDPFLYGGDMVEEVAEGVVSYKPLPWKFTAGTPNIIGTIASGAGINFLINLGLGNINKRDTTSFQKQIETEVLLNTPRGDFPGRFTVPQDDQEVFGEYLEANPAVYETLRDPAKRLVAVRSIVKHSMENIMAYEQQLTGRVLSGLEKIPGVTIYGPRSPDRRSALVAFTINDMLPSTAAKLFNKEGLEVRNGALCASLAHKAYDLTDGSVRIGLYVYNTADEVDTAIEVVAKTAKGAKK
jgi:cysteine desulfurase / selenocysteine lyase